MKETEAQAIAALEELLRTIPGLDIDDIYREFMTPQAGEVDARMDFHHGDRHYTMIVEVKRQSQPRYVRNAIYQLRNYVTHFDQSVHHNRYGALIPMLIAPYLSLESRTICDKHNVAYLDLYGNAHLTFDAVHIDRAVAEKPKSESRSLRSIFSPKAAQILRLMLRDPSYAWRVTELAEQAGVSLGHVSNVRKALLDREWVEEHDDGVILAKPEVLLEAWRSNYRSPAGDSIKGYTHLHGSELQERLRGCLNANDYAPKAVLSHHSAANWIAPFGRVQTHKFYADDEGAERLSQVLHISPAGKGANVTIRVPRDQGVIRDAIEPVDGIYCTSPVQTYLDLWSGNGRDKEAATFLKEEALQWH